MTLTARAVEAVNAQETDEVFLVLLTLDHPDLETPIRVTSDAVDTVSRGETYLRYPFEVDLPDDGDGAPNIRLTIDNVDRAIVTSLRAIVTPPSVTLEVVLAATPDVVEVGPYVFALLSVEYDAMQVSGQLVFEDLLNEGYPGDSYVPSDYPGLFYG